MPATLLRRSAKLAVLPAGLASRRRPGDIAILLYHKVGTGDREIDLPLQLFRAQLELLRRKFTVRALDDVLGNVDGGGIVLSVDDGYRDFHENVLPLLMRYRIPAILYLATGLVGARAAGLGWDQLADAVSTGFVTIGSHTHSHIDLSRATEREAAQEMRRSKEMIEDRLGIACRHFAFPWSVGSPDAERVARRMFDSAAVAWGTNRRRSLDVHALGRLPVLRSDGMRFFSAKVRGWLDHEAVIYRVAGRGPWRKR
jgi:peptidoglycan/xylan/chitin deacetylase (PgdA/CDA1 family)